MDLALDVLTVLLILGAVAAVKWLHSRPAPGATRLTFDEHAATATALLQPDAPMFTEVDDRQVASAVDALLADLFPTVRPASPEESR